jgi:hypothetical protein
MTKVARTWWRHLAQDGEAATETQELFDMALISAEKAEEQVTTSRIKFAKLACHIGSPPL